MNVGNTPLADKTINNNRNPNIKEKWMMEIIMIQNKLVYNSYDKNIRWIISRDPLKILYYEKQTVMAVIPT